MLVDEVEIKIKTGYGGILLKKNSFSEFAGKFIVNQPVISIRKEKGICSYIVVSG